MDLVIQPGTQCQMEHRSQSQEGRESSKLQADGCPCVREQGWQSEWSGEMGAYGEVWHCIPGQASSEIMPVAEKICLELFKELLEAKHGRRCATPEEADAELPGAAGFSSSDSTRHAREDERESRDSTLSAMAG